MSIRVAVAQVDLVVAKVDLGAIKDVHVAVEVDLAKA